MVKREREKETAEDIKQAFRVFDKVGCHKKKQMLRSCKSHYALDDNLNDTYRDSSNDSVNDSFRGSMDEFCMNFKTNSFN